MLTQKEDRYLTWLFATELKHPGFIKDLEALQKRIGARIERAQKARR